MTLRALWMYCASYREHQRAPRHFKQLMRAAHARDAQCARGMFRGLGSEKRLAVRADARNIGAAVERVLREPWIDAAEDLLRHAGIHDADRAVEVPARDRAFYIAEQAVRDGIHGNLIRADIGEAVDQIRLRPEWVERRRRRQRERGIHDGREQLTRGARDVDDGACFLTRVVEGMTERRGGDLLRRRIEYRSGDRQRKVIAGEPS